MSNPIEINQSLLDGGLNLAAEAVRDGETSAEAIDAAVLHVRKRQPLSLLEESRLRAWLEKELPQASRNQRKKPEPSPDTETTDSELYQRIGPTRFVSIGKPPLIFPPLSVYRLIDGQTVRKLSPDCIRRRQIIAVVTAVLFVLAGLFPPWLQTYDLNTTHSQSPAGYSFIASPPQPRDYSYSIGIKLDTVRLSLEFACVIAGGIGAWFLFGGEKKRG